MYSNNNANSNNFNNSGPARTAAVYTYKDTLHISPHIAAHKSSGTISSPASPSLINLSSVAVSAPAMLTPITSQDGMTYKVITSNSNLAAHTGMHQTFSNMKITTAPAPSPQFSTVYRKDAIGCSSQATFIPASSIATNAPNNGVLRRDTLHPGSIIANNSSIITSAAVRTLTNLNRVVPEDLSASSANDMKLQASQQQHVISSTSQPSGVIAPQYITTTATQKPLQHFYGIAGQVPSNLFANVIDKSVANAAYFRHDGNILALLPSDTVLDQTVLAAMPPTSIVGEVVGIVNEPHIKKEHVDIIRETRLQLPSHHHQQQQQHHQQMLPSHIQLPAKDLLKQASFIAGVGVKGNDQEVIEYSYNENDINHATDLLLMNLPGGSGMQAVRQAMSVNTVVSVSAPSGTSHSTSAATAGHISLAPGTLIDANTGSSLLLMQASAAAHQPQASHTPVAHHPSPHSHNNNGNHHASSAHHNNSNNSHHPSLLSAVTVQTPLTSANIVHVSTQSSVSNHHHTHHNQVMTGAMVQQHQQQHQQQIQQAHHQQLQQQHNNHTLSLLQADPSILSTVDLSSVVAANVHNTTSNNTIINCTNNALNNNTNVTNNNNNVGQLSQVKAPKRNKGKLASEEETVLKRRRLAQMMREKRANESENQKANRRVREAERMRKRRAQESEHQKKRRREEAALRARDRRAKMSTDQRQLDRRKAAERMRLRRLQEGDQQKQIRRMRAAERMRLRRANETPEQRDKRRQNLALRMKNRRRRKQEEVGIGPTNPNYILEDPLRVDDLSDMRTISDISSLDGMQAQDLSSSMNSTSAQDTLHEALLNAGQAVAIKTDEADEINEHLALTYQQHHGNDFHSAVSTGAVGSVQNMQNKYSTIQHRLLADDCNSKLMYTASPTIVNTSVGSSESKVISMVDASGNAVSYNVVNTNASPYDMTSTDGFRVRSSTSQSPNKHVRKRKQEILTFSRNCL